jgi:N-methylhydantoinase B
VDGTSLNPKRTVELSPAQLLVIGLPGGGGLGDPRERDPELVRQDVLDGLVSVEQARDAYGVALSADGTLDLKETARLRSAGGTS